MAGRRESRKLQITVSALFFAGSEDLNLKEESGLFFREIKGSFGAHDTLQAGCCCCCCCCMAFSS